MVGEKGPDNNKGKPGTSEWYANLSTEREKGWKPPSENPPAGSPVYWQGPNLQWGDNGKGTVVTPVKGRDISDATAEKILTPDQLAERNSERENAEHGKNFDGMYIIGGPLNQKHEAFPGFAHNEKQSIVPKVLDASKLPKMGDQVPTERADSRPPILKAIGVSDTPSLLPTPATGADQINLAVNTAKKNTGPGPSSA